MHLNLNDTVAAARLTPAALHVKAETAFGIALCLRIRCRCKQIADQIEYAGICGRIRTRGSSDRGLVDGDDLIQLFHTFNALVLARNGPCPV